MSDADLDIAYENGRFIPDGAGYPPRWAEAAAGFRARLGARARLGLPYGPGARQRFDLFLPEAAPAGLLVVLHGGFWRRFGREDWSHLAGGGVARGWAVAVPSYTLAPDARIRQMTAETAAALGAAAAALPEGPVVVTGHSAGGHLGARMLCPDIVLPGGLEAGRPLGGRLRRVLPISPLSDLRPLTALAMNADWKMDAAEAAAESPVLHRPHPGTEVHVWVGGAERPAFLDQARWLGEAWGVPVTVEPERHHFDVIAGLEQAESPLTEALLRGL